MKTNGNDKIKGNYYVGVDAGTNSVGWAVTDHDYNLLKFKGKHMWGVRLFEEANDASARRMARGNRRRLERTKKRLELLEVLFNNEIVKEDLSFFVRMHDSNLYQEDKTDKTCSYSLFNDSDFSDVDYLKKYPTIYHLRKELIESKEPHDPRLVFLAIHHILKNRGHFLFDTADTETKTIDEAISDFKDYLDSCDMKFNPNDIDAFKEALSNRDNIGDKEKELLKSYGELEKNSDSQFDLKLVIKLLSGGKTDLDKLYKDEELKESGFKSVSLNDDLDNQYDDLSSLLGDDVQLIYEAKEVYDIAHLNQILGDDKYLSEAKVRLYDKNNKDLKILKQYFIKRMQNGEITKDEYDLVFKKLKPEEKKKDKKKELNNLSVYIGEDGKSCSQEDFCKFLKKHVGDMKDSEDEEERRVYAEIDNYQFLTKLRSKENGLIPYQLQLKELKAILVNAKEYLPFLSSKGDDGISVEDKIISLLTFRIPYYVGPLAKPNNNNKAWLERKDDVIYPWNFSEVVDLQKSAKNFMKKLVGRCTYTGEMVLPKDSLLYSKYMVLNEINNIKVNGNSISVEAKQQIYKDLFLGNKKAKTKKSIKQYMIANGIMEKTDEISGIDDKINSNLKSYHDFKNILDKTNNDTEMIEEIIEHILVFGSDKKMLRKWLSEFEVLDENDKKHILRLNYKDWGRLSKTFLKDEKNICHIDKRTGEAQSIIDRLWNTNDNLMVLLSKKYDFNDAVQKYREEHFGLNLSLKAQLDEMYIAPAVRRSVLQTMRIIDEIVDVKKSYPEKIFIEMARTSSKEMEKKRTESRKDKLKKLYDSCKKQTEDLIPEGLYDSLMKETDQSLRRDRLYFYYTQMGRCMYTGELIDLGKLLNDKDKYYDIDHIFPQSKVIDDSIDNRVLVKSTENRDKTNIYPIKEETRAKMYKFWTMLFDKGLISPKKYERLKRATPLTKDELSSFVQRQLVETQQSTKALTDILKRTYPGTTVVYSKAMNVTRFRQKYQIPKFRNVNDYHHAKDAYLNVVVGNVFDTKFTKDFINHIMEKQDDYSLNRVFEFNTPGAWVAPKREESYNYDRNHNNEILSGTIETVYKFASKNTPIVTFAPTQQKGELYDLNILPKNNRLLPIKKNLPPEKYGGYNSITGTYFFLVEHTEKKKRVRTILPVYLYALKEYESNPVGYCIKNFGLVEPLIIVKKILMNSLFEINGSRLIITGRSGESLLAKHTYELAIDDERATYLKRIDKYVSKCNDSKKPIEVTEYDGITIEENVNLYNWFIDRLESNAYKNLFKSALKDLADNRDKFKTLDISDQSILLNEILKLFICDRQLTKFEKLNGKGKIGEIKPSATLSKNQSVYLINQSVTGLYETKVDLLKG